jgi:hypothetical protein
LQWKAFCRKALFFVAVKKRPTEAIFRAYKKRVLQKILEWKAGIGTKKLPDILLQFFILEHRFEKLEKSIKFLKFL